MEKNIDKCLDGIVEAQGKGLKNCEKITKTILRKIELLQSKKS